MGQFTPGGPEQATQVLSGQFTGTGTSAPIPVYGMMNIAIWNSATTSLTTTNGSSNASVSVGTGIAAGQTIYSPAGNVPNGTTWATFSGTSGTLNFPTLVIPGILNGSTKISGLSTTTGLVGATVTGPGIPASTTVSSIDTPAVGGTGGIVVISNPATLGGPSNPTQLPINLNFALTNGAVVSGTDTHAIFEDTTNVSATVNIERSFDGGITWNVCGVGGGGTQASYVLGTTCPINIVPSEVERGVFWRFNCVAYSSGIVNYRLSITGEVTTSWGGIYGT